MKKLDKLEKYVREPDTQFYGAYFYDGEDILLHDEVEEFNDEKGNLESRLTIKDTIENSVFKKYKLFEDIKNNAKEETKREFAVKEGDMLIFVMYEGFTKTHTPLITINSAIDRLKMLDSRNYDENGELKK